MTYPIALWHTCPLFMLRVENPRSNCDTEMVTAIIQSFHHWGNGGDDLIPFSQKHLQHKLM